MNRCIAVWHKGRVDSHQSSLITHDNPLNIEQNSSWIAYWFFTKLSRMKRAHCPLSLYRLGQEVCQSSVQRICIHWFNNIYEMPPSVFIMQQGVNMLSRKFTSDQWKFKRIISTSDQHTHQWLVGGMKEVEGSNVTLPSVNWYEFRGLISVPLGCWWYGRGFLWAMK